MFFSVIFLVFVVHSKLFICLASREVSVVFVEVWFAPEVTRVVVDWAIVPVAHLPAGDVLHQISFVVAVFVEVFHEQPLLFGHQEGC